MEEVNLNELLREVVDSASSGIKDKVNLEIELKVDQRISSIIADEGRLTQVVNNLLSNALKFTYECVVKVTSTLEVAKSESSKMKQLEQVKIEVSDGGPGIPVDILPKLFTKFST